MHAYIESINLPGPTNEHARTTPWSLTLHANGEYEVDTNSTIFH
jgi:hypothetical protein